jgi:hypothetical protein
MQSAGRSYGGGGAEVSHYLMKRAFWETEYGNAPFGDLRTNQKMTTF